MLDKGIQLQLFIGPTMPVPAPQPVVDALRDIEVRNQANDRDGFQLTFNLSKDTIADYGLISNGYFAPLTRVVVCVVMNGSLQVLIDGVVTHQQASPSNQPGESVFVITGEDISLRLDLEDKDRPFPNMPDFAIVQQILAPYAQYGVTPDVQFTMDVPIETERIPTQRQTDLSYIQQLARRNEFVFYIEPTGTPGVTTAYWGPENRRGQPQPALTMNMGAYTNLDSSPTFSFDALKPVKPEVSILESLTGLTLPIPLPQIGLPASLSGAPAEALRTVLSDDTARLSPLQAGLRALGLAGAGSDAVTVSGELDVLRYGQPLKARRLVGMRGVGNTFGGIYFVQQLTHRIQRGKYTQQFTLARDGLKATTPMVPVLT